MGRKVAIYARVSTEHEAQLSALENQVQYYDEKLKAHPEWDLYEKYIDEGITGTSIHKRKNFMRMLEDAKKGYFDLIVTREVSRFARNTVDTLQVTRDLKRIGVEVYFTEDNIWTFKDDDGELKLTIMATLAQNESKKTSQRVKAGQMISFQNGVFYGTGNILGYDKVGKDMIINEEQAKTVKLIYEMFLKGEGSTNIKYELEKRGCVTPTGLTKWSPSYINRILKNPFYCGIIEYRKSYIPDFLEQKAKLNHGEVEKVVVEGRHEPIISKEDFERVQKMIKVRCKNNNVGAGIPKNVWSKKLKCECGSSFNKRLYHKKDNGNTYCFQCYHQKTYGSLNTRIKRGLPTDDVCDVPLVQDWKLYTMANFLFRKIWSDKDKIKEVINKLLDEVITDKEACNDLEDEINNINVKINTNNNKLKNLLDMVLNEYINKEEYKIKKEEIEKNNELLENQKKELENKYGIPKDSLKERIKNIKKKVDEHLGNANKSVSDDMLEEIVESITVHKNYFEWKLNYLNDIIELNINSRQGKSTGNTLYVDEVELVTQTTSLHKLQSKLGSKTN